MHTKAARSSSNTLPRKPPESALLPSRTSPPRARHLISFWRGAANSSNSRRQQVSAPGPPQQKRNARPAFRPQKHARQKADAAPRGHDATPQRSFPPYNDGPQFDATSNRSQSGAVNTSRDRKTRRERCCLPPKGPFKPRPRC